MRILPVVAVGALFLAGCSTGDVGNRAGDGAVQGSASEAIEESTAEPGNEAAGAIDADVVVEAGGLAMGRLEVGGQTVDYVIITPGGFSLGDAAPVLLAFPPGGQNLELTQSVAEQTYVSEAIARGWVVLSPAAPVGGPLWYDGSETLVPAILDWVDTWVEPEGGSVHVAGASNGGLSAFAVAAVAPDRVQTLLVYPGFPRSDDAKAALSALVNVPVRMFVGETDAGWVEAMQSAFDTLTDLGGDAKLEIVPGEGHIIGALRDGVRIFDELDANRPG